MIIAFPLKCSDRDVNTEFCLGCVPINLMCTCALLFTAREHNKSVRHQRSADHLLRTTTEGDVPRSGRADLPAHGAFRAR
eukprot:SAG31_NODE_5907_length_2263_cov_1.661275_2_plen_80_part_00